MRASLSKKNREPDDTAKPGPTIVPEEKKGGDESNVAPSKTGGHVTNVGLLATFHLLARIKEIHTLFLTTGSLHLLPYLRKTMWLMNPKCYECDISSHLSSACLN
jgi:hypothetical protein